MASPTNTHPEIFLDAANTGKHIIGKIRPTPILIMNRDGVTHDTIPYFMERFADAYAAEIRDFVTCIVEDREPAVTGQDGRAAAAIGIAATLSLDEGGPVTVPEVE